MALVPDLVFGTVKSQLDMRRAIPHEDGVQPKTFASAVGAPKLARLTPVAFDTSVNLWKVWANAGINGVNLISGFVYPEDIQLSATGEVIACVFILGLVHRDDVVLPAGETQVNLDTALKQVLLRQKGLIIQGLAGVQ